MVNRFFIEQKTGRAYTIPVPVPTEYAWEGLK